MISPYLNRPSDVFSAAETVTPLDRDDTLKTEAIGKASKFRARAIYRGDDGILIVRSRREWCERAGAHETGHKAADSLGCRLRIEIVIEDADRAHSAPTLGRT